MLEHFTDLDDELAVGSYPHTPEHVADLAQRAACRALVNLQSDEDLRARGLDWGVLWQLHLRARITATRVPIRDFDPADLARHLDQAVDAIADHVAAGKKTYVHCNAGVNRSPSAIIAYVVLHRGLTLKDAIGWLGERHACMPYPDVLEAWVVRRGLPPS